MMRRNKFLATACALALAALPSIGEAAIICSGPVNSVKQNTDGWVIVDWGSYGQALVCSMATPAASPTTTVAIASCQGILSLALSAKGMNKNFGAYFPTLTSCSGIQSGGWLTAQPANYLVMD